MRISDWSSDVCSSDLHAPAAGRVDRVRLMGLGDLDHADDRLLADRMIEEAAVADLHRLHVVLRLMVAHAVPAADALADHVVPRIGLGLALEEPVGHRSEEHTSELQSLMRISYAVFCLKKKHKKYEQKQ